MKKGYKKPTAAMINYTYDDQVVAASTNYNGYGDGHYTGYCQYWNGSTTGNGCTDYWQAGSAVCNKAPDMTRMLGIW